MIIPKKVLGLSLVLLILAAAGYFFVLKKAPSGENTKTAGGPRPRRHLFP
jgi:hypothetical protein